MNCQVETFDLKYTSINRLNEQIDQHIKDLSACKRTSETMYYLDLFKRNLKFMEKNGEFDMQPYLGNQDYDYVIHSHIRLLERWEREEDLNTRLINRAVDAFLCDLDKLKVYEII